jgi:hypothetical protein
MFLSRMREIDVARNKSEVDIIFIRMSYRLLSEQKHLFRLSSDMGLRF